MPKISTKWPMLSVSDVDAAIIKELRTLPGVFRSAEARDILMTAAAIAVKNNLPEAAIKTKQTKNDIMNGPTLGSEPLSQYRQIMILIFYITQAKDGDLGVMSDTKTIVENFKDYAHRGLLYLSETCKDPHGNEKLLKQYEDALVAIHSDVKQD